MKWQVVAPVCFFTIAVWTLALSSRSQPTSRVSLAPEPAALVQPVQPEPTQAPHTRRADVASVRPNEADVVSMYDALAQAYTQHSTDCDAIGDAFERTVAEHAQTVDQLVRWRATLDADGKAAFDQHLQENFGSRLMASSQVLQTAFAQCVANDKVKRALRTLADLGQS